MLPGLSIKFDNGNIGTTVSTADGVFGLLASAVAVVDKFELNKPYTVKGMADVAALGILPDLNNYALHKWLSEFYAEAGEGAELWLMGFAQDTKVSDWFTPDAQTGKAPVQDLMDASNGRISALFTCFSPDGDYVVVDNDGLDADVAASIIKAQTFAESYTANRFTPIFVILEGYAFSGSAIDLPDLTEDNKNRVGVLIGNTKEGSELPATLGAASACLAGRLAVIAVQENPGMVKRGALAAEKLFINDVPVELFDVAALHDKGYITFRTHERKAGYYLTDDPLATGADDDYRRINRRRVIDKAYRIAHSIASDEILADFDLTNEGKISPIYAKDIEGKIENAIFNQMTANGELSRDQSNPDDLGVEAVFNTDLNVAQTNRIELSLKVRPRGSADFFVINLGYDVSLNTN
ncbi:DUF2586 family protein [Leeuwenhoekiella parthenopeia]|uniref:DUF2586 family protein n=1 Tax=Leeuwenhoekiella parthenopeia TaxID=2890320 RepID=A0ABS8GNV4_9FLAO|nr:DUF2586 family protein [Leeuwenhoekiella parthenopeia]MCC4211353.1 DUF2586 family protein [Leeuwenhoekiella parthenopeia]